MPCGDWRRRLNPGWDLYVIKDMLELYPHTKRMVGYAHDAFDVDVTCEEFKRKYKVVAADEVVEAEVDNELTEATTVDANRIPNQKQNQNQILSYENTT